MFKVLSNIWKQVGCEPYWEQRFKTEPAPHPDGPFLFERDAK